MKSAFVFPGQGSQSVGMMSELIEKFATVRDTFNQASEILGYDLLEIIAQGPRERLDQTEVTQPAMLAAGVATWRVWCESNGPAPAVVAGHSLGEYTALVAAGALSFEDAVATVQKRGQAMQAAVEPGAGAMAAILGLDDDLVCVACSESSEGQETVEPVNFNAPGQVVIAGHAGAVERAVSAARAAGARRAVLLPVSVPSHSSLMQPAAQALQPHLETIAFRSPQIEVVSSVDARLYQNTETIRNNLVAQVHRPVLWVATINALSSKGIQAIVECGPGKVLTGLNRRIVKGSDIETSALIDPDSLNQRLSEQGVLQ